jgi:hypothetical protein
MQNKHDIRNQHQNLHQVTCVLSKNIFCQNSRLGGTTGKNGTKIAEGEYGRFFDQKIFFDKTHVTWCRF